MKQAANEAPGKGGGSRDMGEREVTRDLWLTFASYSALVALQVSAFLVTNVLVLLALSLDRLSDIMISLFFLASLSISMRPADPLHAFGHTRVQNVAALVVSGVLVFYLSLETFRGAVPRLLDPSLVETTDLGVAVAVTLVSMAVIAVPSVMLIRTNRKGLSRAQLINLLLDEFSCGTTLITLALVSTGYPIADPIGSIVVGVAILMTGVFLFRENAAILIGRSPGKEYEERLKGAVLSVEGVKGIHGLRAELVGPDAVHADLHIELAPDTPVSEADLTAQEVRRRLKEVTGCVYCEVHTDPYQPDGGSPGQ